MKKETFNHKNIESKWQEKWTAYATYTPDLASNKKRKFYNLMMFPYPSAEGLHVGSMYAFGGADVYARFKRMNGYATFEPIGLDGFGIHSENFAIKVGRHPKKHAEISEKNFYKQLASIGNSFAWDHRLETYDPDYYRWTQWLFIKLFEAGLAYRDTATVNWCPFDKTVLSDEQVENGECERCGNQVERKQMSSWFFKITEYADQLLDNIEKINWPEKIKSAQRQWIGRKTGLNITYKIKDSQESITVFTTRPDTNFGATFIVVAPEYAKENLLDLIPSENKDAVSKYINTSLSKSEQDRKIGEKDKTGEFTGLYAVNPLNNFEMPIYVADYVLMDVGTGAVVGVPGHDRRDFDFAKKFGLEKVCVVSTDGKSKSINSIEDVYEEDGVAVNSDFLNGLNTKEATEKIIDHMESKGWGERVTSYHLRDWGISRQRYWGPPIPMINCESCGWVPEKEENLPVILPDIEDFKPKGDGTSPLSNAPDEWKYVDCPKCGGKAEREQEVSDTFLDSSWYFLAFPNLKTDEFKNGPTPFNKEITEKWLPVDTYIGGAEHAVLHLLYARFIWMVLYDLKLIPQSLGDEPFPFLFGHGLIIKDGAKMSKSKGNVINPDEYIEKYGADALRTYLMFLGPYEGGGDFRDSGIEGMKKFIDRVYTLVSSKDIKLSKSRSKDIQSKLHKTIKKVTEDFDTFKYNTAISAIMELTNLIYDSISNDSDTNQLIDQSEVTNILSTITKLMAPLAPFMTEEVWHKVYGNQTSIHLSEWPDFSESLTIDDVVSLIVQVNGKYRASMEIDLDQSTDESYVSDLAKSDEKIINWIEGKEIKKTIFVPGKLINFVV